MEQPKPPLAPQSPHLWHRSAARLMMAGVSLGIATGCVSGVTDERLSEELTVGGAETLPFTSEQRSYDAPDLCALHSPDKPLLAFNSNLIINPDRSVEDRSAESGRYESIVQAMPFATPSDFVDYYVSMRRDEIGDDLAIILDASSGLEYWDSTSKIPEGGTLTEQQSRLYWAIARVASEVSRWPEGIFATIGVDTLRIGYSGEDRKGGHYDTLNNEIQFEYYDGPDNEVAPGFNHSLIQVDYIMTHEFAHAAHDLYCAGNFHSDSQIAGDIKFVGSPPGILSDSQILDWYADNISPNQLEYGLDRVFPSLYSTKDVVEYFAEIVQFTLNERGLILADDADFGSTLHRNQVLIIDRLDALFPGFAQFAEQKTRMLRFDPENEIYKPFMQEIKLTASQLDELKGQLADDSNLTINGVWASAYSTESFYPFPILDGRGLTWFGEAGSGITTAANESGVLNLAMFVFGNPSDINSILVSESEIPEVNRYFAPRERHWVGDEAVLDVLERLQASGRLVPVRITLQQ